jgi:hypothetical protein
MSFNETLVLNDGTEDKSYVTIIRNGRSTTRRSTAASDPATETQSLTISNQDVDSKGVRSTRSLVQVQKTKINSSLVPLTATVNMTINIPVGNLFSDVDVAKLLLTAGKALMGTAMTQASAATNVGRLRLGES